MPEQNVTVRCQFTLLDLIQARQVYRATTLEAKIDKLYAVFFFVMACLMVISNTYRWWAILVFLMAPFAWFDLLYPLRLWITVRQNPMLLTGEYELTFDDQGCYAKTNEYEARRSWSAYTTALESDKMFVLVYGKNRFATVPKRAFSNTEEISQVRELLKSKIGQVKNVQGRA